MSPFGIGGGGGSLVAPPPVDFHVDWSNSVGTSVAALGDGGKLVFGGGGGFCEVVDRAAEVAARSLPNVPTSWGTNLFRVDPTQGWEFWQANDQWPAPAQGEYMFLRYGIYLGLPEGAILGGGSKIAQSNAGAISWVFLDTAGVVNASGGGIETFFASLRSSSPSPAGGSYRNNGGLITYRPYEIGIRLENVPGSDLTFRPSVRILQLDVSTTVPHLTSADYTDSEGVSLLDDAPVISSGSASEAFRSIIFGNSDQTGTDGNGGHFYLNGFAARGSTSPDGWIEPYPTTGESP